MGLADVSAATGLLASDLMTLVRSGHLDQIAGRGTVQISRHSLIRWATGYRPDLLQRLGHRWLRAVDDAHPPVDQRTA